MKEGIENGDYKFINLFLEYRFGKPISASPIEVFVEKEPHFINIINPETGEVAESIKIG